MRALFLDRGDDALQLLEAAGKQRVRRREELASAAAQRENRQCLCVIRERISC